MKTEKENVHKKNKLRFLIVTIFLILFVAYLFVTIRGCYLQTLEIGEKFKNINEQKLKYKANVIFISFTILYILTYVITKIIKKGLKKFFVAEKLEMPKLPTKSICFIFSSVMSIIIGNLLTQKIITAMNATSFGQTDPIFNLDLGYYLFQKPLIETALTYFIGLLVIYCVYIAAYYIIVFNKFLVNGVDRELLKKSLFLKQLIFNLVMIAIAGSALILVKTQDIVSSKFLTLSDGTALYGAGTIEATVKLWGYRIFSIVVLICSIMAVISLKKISFKKVAFWLCGIPVYLVVLFLVMLGTNLIYVNKNELDKEKYYIEKNIEYTQNAYNINIDEVQIEDLNTLTLEDINQNSNVINNINLSNKNAVISTLNQYKTNLGYYTYNTSKAGIYNIDGENKLLYISPREILSNETRTYNNKTYEYTHGYGIIATMANTANENGSLEYVQSEFNSEEQKIKISEPRIYFGMETNEYIVINAKNKEEYDYPLTNTTNATTTYTGNAGLKLNFIDRTVLGLKEKNIKLAFAGNSNSTIITTRNVRERAKAIMPYLMYDEEPYMIVSDNGDLVWVIDAYTISKEYPYSTEITIEYEGNKQKINYIRNSVKVIVNAYTGEMDFYITDRTDPIVMAYNKMFPGLFEETNIPNEISSHIVYSEFLYKIQAEILQKYHNVQAEVLYREDDVWSIAKENTSKNTTGANTGTEISPYYTMVKTVDSDNMSLGLVIPYTIQNRQNLVSYLVGIYDATTNTQKLTMYRFITTNAILGTNQLDSLAEQDEQIEKEIEAVNVIGAKITKNIIVVPINNSLLYVEPIYQTNLNEDIQVPILKKVIVASGNKIAIGNTLTEALNNLLSQDASTTIEVNSDDKDGIIEQIINANNNLKQSNQSNDWELIGRDMTKLQELINELEVMVKNENTNTIDNETTQNTSLTD